MSVKAVCPLQLQNCPWGTKINTKYRTKVHKKLLGFRRLEFRRLEFRMLGFRSPALKKKCQVSTACLADTVP